MLFLVGSEVFKVCQYELKHPVETPVVIFENALVP
jgi:hypothetical protein